MIWWYRNIFIDRSMPLTSERSQAKPCPKQQEGRKSRGLMSKVFIRLKAIIHEKLKSHYDWKVYRNLSDHQLKDIGITRYDLHLLLQNKTPTIPHPRIANAGKPNIASPHEQLIRESELTKPIALSANRVCCNDSENKVA